MEWTSVRINEGHNCPDLSGLVKSLVKNGYQPWDIMNKKHLESKEAHNSKTKQEQKINYQPSKKVSHQ